MPNFWTSVTCIILEINFLGYIVDRMNCLYYCIAKSSKTDFIGRQTYFISTGLLGLGKDHTFPGLGESKMRII